jgi:phenylalanyl-tRNA synthetase beta chain
MKILLSWLKEFVELSIPPPALAQRLTMAGTEVTSLERMGSDWLFELEVTPNRPDLLSYLGLAREAAAVLGRRFRSPRWLERRCAPWPSSDEPAPVTIHLEDREACRRYVGIVIEAVTVKPSPPWIAERLAAMGLRPVNNVVDATNLVLFELGQPLHAFDLEALKGQTLRVRRARTGEKLLTIDGQTRELSTELLVIADVERPVALAGVIGGRETEIGPKTRRVLLESAWFDPARVRRASRNLRLATDSSYRFERGVDFQMVWTAALRAARLIQELSGGRLDHPPVDVVQEKPARRRITLYPQRAQRTLGMLIYPAQQRRLLERIGCSVTGSVKRWTVSPPSWRSDLKIPEDLHEELARLWGYERCPATLPAVSRQPLVRGWKPVEDPWVEREKLLKRLLKETGFQEMVTYSLVSEETLSHFPQSQRAAPRLQNPLSAEFTHLRPQLMVGALRAAAVNLLRKSAERLQFFETGKIFSSTAPLERRALSLLAAGSPEGFLAVKGAVQFLADRMGLGPVREEALEGAEGLKGTALRLYLGKEPLGICGMVEERLLSAFEIPTHLPVAFAQLDLEPVAAKSDSPLQVRPLPKVPPVVQDLAIVVPEDTPHGLARETILKAGDPLLKGLALIDLYRGSQVPAGKKSFCFRLSYSAGDRTLTDEEVAASHQKIVETLKARFGATLR